MFDQLKKANRNDDSEGVPLFSISDEDDATVENEVYEDTLPLLALSRF